MTRKKSPQEIEINRQFGQNLKQARKQLNINQTVAARRIGVELVTYQSYEQGRRFPSNETLEAICNALNVRLSELVDPSWRDLHAISPAKSLIALTELEKAATKPAEVNDDSFERLRSAWIRLNDNGKGIALSLIESLLENDLLLNDSEPAFSNGNSHSSVAQSAERFKISWRQNHHA